MVGATKREAAVVTYALEVEIDAPAQRVWNALTNEINAWWLPDFHMVASDSTVRFDARAGGCIVEEAPDGSSLLWYTVQMIQPAARTVYLVGHLAPDWGGPSCSHLKLAIEPRGEGCTLKIDDAYHGNVDEKTVQSLSDGWGALFTDGLKRFSEQP